MEKKSSHFPENTKKEIVPGDSDKQTLVEEDGKWFYIDHCGEPIISRGTLELPKVLNCVQYIEYGIKEGSGHKAVPPIYDAIYDFNKNIFDTVSMFKMLVQWKT